MVISTAVGRKGLVLEGAGRLAVHGVGEVGPELFEIDLVDAAADLLVRREQDLDRAVPDVGIVDQDLRRRHDLGYARLVVGAQQRRAVGGDDVVADLVVQFRMLADLDDPLRIARQHDVAAGIVAHDLRLDVGAGEVGRGVHVRAEADDRHRLVDIRRNGRVDIAVLVEMRVSEPHGQQFADQHAAEILLLVGRGLRLRLRVRLGVDDDIAKETIGHGVGHGRKIQCSGDALL